MEKRNAVRLKVVGYYGADGRPHLSTWMGETEHLILFGRTELDVMSAGEGTPFVTVPPNLSLEEQLELAKTEGGLLVIAFIGAGEAPNVHLGKQVSWSCFDCGAPDSCYFVHDAVWYAAIPDYDELQRARSKAAKEQGLERHHYSAAAFVGLCFACLAKRLGRSLRLDDFTSHPINEPIRFGFNLGRESLLLGPVVPEHGHQDGEDRDADGGPEQHT